MRNALGLQGHCWCLEVSIGWLKIVVVLPLMTLYNRLLIVDQKYTVVTGEQAGIVAIVLDKADTMGNRVDDYLNCNRGLLAMDRHGYWHC